MAEAEVTWRQAVQWRVANDKGRLSTKERKFVVDMTYRLAAAGKPTERQARWLEAIDFRLRTAR